MKRLNLWTIATALALLPSAVMATSVVAETIEELSRAAPIVVRGTVRQVQTQFDERFGEINTYADVQVTEVIKGATTITSVLVKSPGGEINGRGQRVAGAARFIAGQDTVLFMQPAVDESGVFIVRSLAAGKVDFERTAKGQLQAVRHLEGLAFFAGRAGTVQPQQELGTADAFLNRVRQVLRGGAR